MLRGEADDIGEERETVPQPAGPETNNEEFVVRRPHGFLNCTDF
jgi:hypothetical protein